MYAPPRSCMASVTHSISGKGSALVFGGASSLALTKATRAPKTATATVALAPDIVTGSLHRLLARLGAGGRQVPRTHGDWLRVTEFSHMCTAISRPFSPANSVRESLLCNHARRHNLRRP